MHEKEISMKEHGCPAKGFKTLEEYFAWSKKISEIKNHPLKKKKKNETLQSD